jgi:iron complex transport system substrate-binding protein
LTICLLACIALASSSALLQADPVTIVNYHYDLSENVEVFDKPPERAVSTNGSATELLLALGVEKRMIGTAFLDNPPMPGLQAAYNSIPVLSRQYPGKEQVLELEPDFIVGWHSAFSSRILGDPSYWNRLGVGTFIMRDSSPLPKSMDNACNDILDLGRIFHSEEKAGQIVSGVKAELASMRARSAKRGKKLRVLLLEPLPGGRMRAWGDNSTPGQMLLAIGAENVFPQTGDQNKEGVVTANPDAVVFIYMDSSLPDALRLMEDFQTDPILGWTNASRAKRLGLAPLSETYCPGVRLASGLRTMSGVIFKDGDQSSGLQPPAAPPPAVPASE